ncbi:hypothetical protein B0T26DRAFT_738155 [Lasiosphaeria miniovina]|uniref:J domain-containing protein n=1 Tax=Lasiosphaeria miniovina TaxID=1954250 RepID=A0AA40B4D6_9PEZI|nr:uncharacterized protein B0T26DRAFT_738155 [Lasiosphaeria miniovina]KAK0727437.1 hypothetical protein B0T26DRAFT_738155 [Lasiosphaeria miniovina]
MNSLLPDPWMALGLDRTADKSEVRAAYKRLVLKCHPDKVQDPILKAQKHDEFQKVQQAYELLNDDVERSKYEEQVRLMEQRVRQQANMKNMPNSSASRTSPRNASFDVRNAEPTRFRTSTGSTKVYTYSSPHTRSHDDVPSSRIHPVFEEMERKARRTASYDEKEKPSRREEERRERRRREEEEMRAKDKEREREREREREKEREREAKAEKKKLEKEQRDRYKKQQDRERARESDEKAHRHKPYVEPYGGGFPAQEEETYLSTSARPEKKRSSSKKHSENRDRDRERERERERDKSSSRPPQPPLLETVLPHEQSFSHARSYIAFWKSKSQSPLEPIFSAPTPPPAAVAAEFLEEDILRRSTARAAGRRSSHDTPKKETYVINTHSTPPIVPGSPPRVSAYVARTPMPTPTLSRGQTWTAGTGAATSPDDHYNHYGGESDEEPPRPRRSRRARSPRQQTHYRVDEGRSPSSRRYMPEVDSRSSPLTASYPGGFMPADISFSEYHYPSISHHDQFVPAS